MSTTKNVSRSPSLLSCLISGGTAGLSVDIVLFPLDTIKTRLQSKDGLRRSGGFRGIYSGIGPVMFISAPTSALFFVTYESSKRLLSYNGSSGWNPSSTRTVFLAAMISELMATTIRVPAEIIKQRRQVFQFSHTWMAIRHTYTTNGLLGFYQGFLPMIMRDLPFAAIQFTLYEKCKLMAASRLDNGVTSKEGAIIGAVAGGTSAMVTCPLDVIKTRTMLYQSIAHVKTPSMYQIAKDILLKEGVKRLWSGVIPRVFWITLGGGIYFGIYEKVTRALYNYEI